MSREVRQVIRAAARQGWAWRYTRGGHLRLESPEGALVFASATPSDKRGLRNTVARMRRHGFVWPR